MRKRPRSRYAFRRKLKTKTYVYGSVPSRCSRYNNQIPDAPPSQYCKFYIGFSFQPLLIRESTIEATSNIHGLSPDQINKASNISDLLFTSCFGLGYSCSYFMFMLGSAVLTAVWPNCNIS